MRFILYRDRKGEFRWRLLAANGRVIADSAEGYKRRRSRDKAIKLIRLGASSATIVPEIGTL